MLDRQGECGTRAFLTEQHEPTVGPGGTGQNGAHVTGLALELDPWVQTM